MSRLVSSLFAPVDPVVAVRDSAEQAEAAIDRLGRAGFPSRMLAVVASHVPDPGEDIAPALLSVRQWLTSGMFWGMLWAALALIGAAVVARHVLPPGMVLMIGALLLGIQIAIVSWCLGPEGATQVAWRGSAPSDLPYAGDLAANRMLLLVSGSRSEIALARSLLQMRDVPISDA